MSLSIFRFSEPVWLGNELLGIHTDAGTGTGTAHQRTVTDVANARGG